MSGGVSHPVGAPPFGIERACVDTTSMPTRRPCSGVSLAPRQPGDRAGSQCPHGQHPPEQGTCTSSSSLRSETAMWSPGAAITGARHGHSDVSGHQECLAGTPVRTAVPARMAAHVARAVPAGSWHRHAGQTTRTAACALNPACCHVSHALRVRACIPRSAQANQLPQGVLTPRR